LVIVQVNVYDVEAASPVTVVVGELIFENVMPAEGLTVQTPVSFKTGVLAAMYIGVPKHLSS